MGVLASLVIECCWCCVGARSTMPWESNGRRRKQRFASLVP